MKTPKNNSHPEKETVFSAGHGNEDQLSFCGKILGSGKRAAQRGFTFIEIAFVITAFLVLSAIIYTTVGGSAELEPLKAKSMLQNTRTIAAGVRRVEKYLGTTPMNIRAIQEQTIMNKAYNNSKKLTAFVDTVVGGWTGPYVEGIDVLATISTGAVDVPTGSNAPGATLYYQDLKDIAGAGKKGFLYVGKKDVYYFIGDFASPNDSLLKAYYSICNNTSINEDDSVPLVNTAESLTDDKNCIVPNPDNIPGEGFADTGTDYLRVKPGYIQGSDAANSARYVIGYKIGPRIE